MVIARQTALAAGRAPNAQDELPRSYRLVIDSRLIRDTCPESLFLGGKTVLRRWWAQGPGKGSEENRPVGFIVKVSPSEGY
jgi:hypothetical protein